MAIWDKWLINMRYLLVKFRGPPAKPFNGGVVATRTQQTANFKIKMVPIHDGSNAPHQKKRSGGILVGFLITKQCPPTTENIQSG